MSSTRTFHTPASQRSAVRAITLGVTLLLAVSLLPIAPAGAATVDADTAACLVEKVNAARSAEGLAALTVVDSMVKPSTNHTSAMVAAGELHHSKKISEGAPNPWYWVGENVGYGGDCNTLHRAFMNSRGHRNNILKAQANGVAVGAIKQGNRVWVTVRFVQSPAVPTALPPYGSFTDVLTDNVFAEDIERLATSGITRGCNPPANDRFCPDRSVTRAEMAAFLVRAFPGSAGDSDGFTDVPSGHPFHTDIAAIAASGITKGCNPPANTRFCPDRAVTRGQMAAFLVRALDLPLGGSAGFTDVGRDHVFSRDIAALAAAGITRGCGAPSENRFCPNQPVTRAEMAAFLVRSGA